MAESEDDMFLVKPSTVINDGKRKFHHASVEWEIAEFSRKARKADEEIVSPGFWCLNANWLLSMYPNGQRKNGSVGEVVIYLERAGWFAHEHTVVSEITVIRDNEHSGICQIQHTFRGGNSRCMFPTGYLRSDVLRKDLGYISNGCFTIHCNIFIFEKESPEVPPATATNSLKGPEKKEVGTNTLSPDSKSVLYDDSHTEAQDDIIALSKDFEELHEGSRLADVILKVGQHEFPAHKLVLRSRSKVFEAMFEHNMLENQQDAVDLVEMEAITVKDMLRYIYCGKVRHLSSQEALNLYVAADRYDLQGLVSKCRKIMLNTLSVGNISEIAIVADLHDDQHLMNAVKSLLSKNMKEVIKTEKWMTFSKHDPSLSLSLVHSVILSS